MNDKIQTLGKLLGFSYPLLGLSTGVRSLYQLFFKPESTHLVAASLSLLAAICYIIASVAFFKRTRWAWRLGVGMLSFELLGVLIVGTLSLIYPSVIGRTAWGQFGRDYGFFPLIQPILGLLWLFKAGRVATP
jgi:uncharacterized membrane protein YfcA